MPISSPILSASEEQLLQDPSVFITKAAIDAKISDLFAALKHTLEACLAEASPPLPDAITVTPGRTYRGENLQSLPWRALDCPRLFAGPDMFCFRTLLVWGRDFSFHLLLSGKWLRHYQSNLATSQMALARQGWSMSLQASPWDWSLDASGYGNLSHMPPTDFTQHLTTMDWLKLSMSLPLSQFSSLPAEGAMRFAALLKTLQGTI